MLYYSWRCVGGSGALGRGSCAGSNPWLQCWGWGGWLRAAGLRGWFGGLAGGLRGFGRFGARALDRAIFNSKTLLKKFKKGIRNPLGVEPGTRNPLRVESGCRAPVGSVGSVGLVGPWAGRGCFWGVGLRFSAQRSSPGRLRVGGFFGRGPSPPTYRYE